MSNNLELALRIKADLQNGIKALDTLEKQLLKTDISAKQTSQGLNAAKDKAHELEAQAQKTTKSVNDVAVGLEGANVAAKKAAQGIKNTSDKTRELEAQAQKTAKPIKDVASGLAGTDVAAKKASKGIKNTSDKTRELETELKTLPALLTRMAGLFATAFSVKEIAAASEEYTQIRNRLSLVTKSSEELASAQDSVFQIAQNSRQPLSETAELYQRIATNADALQLSQSGVAAVVDVINKSLAISGTSGASSAAALTQLGQAFASGTLRGEELNSVLEQAPALAKVLADGMGVTVGELRKLGEEGKLTTDNVVQALLSQGTAVDTNFAKIQTAGSQALTILGNSLTKVIGELDTATGANAAFSNTVTEFAKYLDSGALTAGFIESIATWSATFDVMGRDIESLGIELDGVSSAGGAVADSLVAAFKQMPVNLRAAIQIATTEILVLFDKVMAHARYSSDTIKAIFTDATRADAAKALEQRLQQINSLRDDSLAGIMAERDAVLALGKAEKERQESARKAQELAKAEREKEIAALREKAKAKPTAITRTDDSTKEAIADSEKYVQKLEEQAAALTLNNRALQEHKNAQQQLTGTLLARAEAAQAIIDKAQDEKTLAAIQIENLRALGHENVAAQLEFEQQYGELIERLKARGDTSGLSLVDNILDLHALNTRLGEAEKLITNLYATLHAQEQSISAQREAGLITEAEARRRIVELHQQTYSLLQQQKPVLEELAAQPGAVGESARVALASLNEQSTTLLNTVSLLESTLRGSIEQGLTEAITGLAKGTMTFGDAIKSLASTVVDALIRMQAEQMAQSITGSLFNKGAEAATDTAASTATATAITTAGTAAGTAMGTGITTAGTAAGTAMGGYITTAGSTAGTYINSSLITGGTTAATTINAQMIAAGSIVAQQIAAAMKTGGGKEDGVPGVDDVKGGLEGVGEGVGEGGEVSGASANASLAALSTAIQTTTTSLTALGTAGTSTTTALTALTTATTATTTAATTLAAALTAAATAATKNAAGNVVDGLNIGGGKEGDVNGANTSAGLDAVNESATGASTSQNELAQAGQVSAAALTEMGVVSNSVGSALSLITTAASMLSTSLTAAAGSAGVNAAVGGVGAVTAATGGYISGPGTGTSDSIAASLSNGEFVTRAAVVSQPNSLNFLHDFNARGMAALDDWTRVKHSTGGLAGYPAPAMPSPTLGPAQLSNPAVDQNAAMNVRFINVVDPELFGEFAQSSEGERIFTNYIRRNSATVKRMLGGA